MNNLEQRIRTELERQSEAIDGATASRLNQARQAALAQLGRPRRVLLPAVLGGALAAALVVVMLLPGGQPPLDQAELPAELADWEMLTGSGDLALLDELDFYLWVGSQLQGDPLDDPLG